MPVAPEERVFTYVDDFGQERQVLGLQKCVELCDLNSIRADTLIKDEWDYAWKKAREIPELSHLFPPSLEPSASPQFSHEPSGPRGVGVLLLLLILGMALLGPFIDVAEMLRFFSNAEDHYPDLTSLSGWHNYKDISWFVFVGLWIYSAYAAWGLLQGDEWAAVERAIMAIWLRGPVFWLLLFVLFPLFWAGARALEVSGGNASELIAGFVLTLIGPTLWTLYLLKSKRVHNTYNRYSW